MLSWHIKIHHTHAYMGASDSKLLDAQAGLESGMTAMVGAMAGINMISGAGMLDFLSSFSLEKLVFDAEMIGMTKRMLEGMIIQTDPLASDMYDGINFQGNFLKKKLTRDMIIKEQYLPSEVIDRGSHSSWEHAGSKDAFSRSKSKVEKILNNYEQPDLYKGAVGELKSMVEKFAVQAGMDGLPDLDL